MLTLPAYARRTHRRCAAASRKRVAFKHIAVKKASAAHPAAAVSRKHGLRALFPQVGCVPEP